MTHDELLTMIEDKFNNHSGIHDAQIVNSLYRVVELHKPVMGDCCEACYREEYFGGRHLEVGKYPCATIQAIEKELG